MARLIELVDLPLEALPDLLEVRDLLLDLPVFATKSQASVGDEALCMWEPCRVAHEMVERLTIELIDLLRSSIGYIALKSLARGHVVFNRSEWFASVGSVESERPGVPRKHDRRFAAVGSYR